MRGAIVAGILAAGVLAGLQTAAADIRAFNVAVEAGDYRGASAAARETWPGIDRASPEAAATAREFGWIAMLADDPVAALVYAKFLIQEGGALAHPDTSPAVSRVLHDWASMASVMSVGARTRLLAALQARAMIAGRDLISARAAQTLHAEAWKAGEWAQAGIAAELAIRFLDELGATQSPARFEMRRGMASAAFMQQKSAEAYNAVYDIAGELHDLIAVTPEGPIRDRLAAEYFAASAWGEAFYTALGPARQRATADRRLTIGAGRKAMSELLYPAPGDASLPRCRISVTRNFDSPGFPFVSRFRDFGGVVVYALTVEPNGTFSDPRLIVSAPHAGVAEAVDDVMPRWRWKLDAGVAPGSCRMPETHVLTFSFELGR